MKLEITLDDERVSSLISELFEKGCDEVAHAIENEYFKQLDKMQEQFEFRQYSHQYGGKYRALYFKGVHGITYYCEFWELCSDGNIIRRFTTKPFIASTGTVYGTPSTKAFIKRLIADAIEAGLEEV